MCTSRSLAAVVATRLLSTDQEIELIGSGGWGGAMVMVTTCEVTGTTQSAQIQGKKNKKERRTEMSNFDSGKLEVVVDIIKGHRVAVRHCKELAVGRETHPCDRSACACGSQFTDECETDMGTNNIGKSAKHPCDNSASPATILQDNTRMR